MANITKRTDKKGQTSYLIRVFIDEAVNGKQKVKSMTYRPAVNMSQKAIEKELNRQVTLFEEKVKKGLISYGGNIVFSEYANMWIDNAQIAPKTKEGYNELLKRINQAIGHIKLENLKAMHLEAFYKNLKEDGIKLNTLHATSTNLKQVMSDNNISVDNLSKDTGLGANTITIARTGKTISFKSAEKIANALNITLDSIFIITGDKKGLSDKTILHHHRLITTILNKAKKEQLIPFNVASEHTTTPKVKKKEAVFLDDIQAQELVQKLLQTEDIRVKTSILLLITTGIRRGELCGLEWQDIDFNNCIIHVKRASQWQQGKGIVEVPTKNQSSIRAIKTPAFMFDILNDYKKWWLLEKVKNGSRWQAEKERLFIQEDGNPINPDTINYWLDKFIRANSLIRFTPHSLRHTFATLQIMAGVNIRTIQSRTGHSQASTLVNIYSHAIKTADEMASTALEDVLFSKNDKF